MPAMLLFSASSYTLKAADLVTAIHDSFAVTASPWVDGAAATEFPKPNEEGQHSVVFIDLPELEEGEGEPTVEVEITARLDRDETFQEMIDEILSQDKALKPRLDGNKVDIVLHFEDSAAAFETACMVAYVLAEETESGILVPGFEDGEETLWFDNAEDFAQEIFPDDDDEDGGDLEEDDEDDKS